MFNNDRKREITNWFDENGIPKEKWEYILKMLKSHKITDEEGEKLKDILKRYDRLKELTSKMQHDLNLLPDTAITELNILQEDTLLREQFRHYHADPIGKLIPRHLGDIDILLYFSSLQDTLEHIADVKKLNSSEKIYHTLLWFCHSLDEEYEFGINKTKAAEFISACTGGYHESVRKQIDRLMKKHNWNFFKRTN